MKATMRHLDNPYHRGFEWQVNYGNLGKQWFKSETEARRAMEKWNETEEELKRYSYNNHYEGTNIREIRGDY